MIAAPDLMDLYDSTDFDSFNIGRGLDLLSARQFWRKYGAESYGETSPLREHIKLSGQDAKRYLAAGELMDDRHLFQLAITANLSVDTVCYLYEKTKNFECVEMRKLAMYYVLNEAARGEIFNRDRLGRILTGWTQQAIDDGTVCLKETKPQRTTAATDNTDDAPMDPAQVSESLIPEDLPAEARENIEVLPDGRVRVTVEYTQDAWIGAAALLRSYNESFKHPEFGVEARDMLSHFYACTFNIALRAMPELIGVRQGRQARRAKARRERKRKQREAKRH
ncbi:MAG: hypothetical protein Q3972_04020 [Corynebacterium sp.]|nr:hypothetical protein [Corynebacterium sp.]